MSDSLTAEQIFEDVFLQTRAKLLEVAATLDRLERAAGAEAVESDSRMGQIRQGIDLIHGGTGNRAEQLQIIFSDPYDESWKRPGLRT